MISTVKVRRSKKDTNPISVTYDFGGSLKESSDKFDGTSSLDQVVHGLFIVAARAQLQDYVRSLIAVRKPKVKKGKKGAVATEPTPAPVLSPQEIQAKVDQWKPTVERAAKRTVEKAKKVIDGLSAEERKALLDSLTGGTGLKIGASEDA